MVDIRKASRREDFEAVHALVAQLAAWDIGQMEGMGLPTADLVRLYYSETVDDLAAKYGKPNAPAFVGWLEGVPVACEDFDFLVLVDFSKKVMGEIADAAVEKPAGAAARARGEKVIFSTGTDEHGGKIAEKAAELIAGNNKTSQFQAHNSKARSA